MFSATNAASAAIDFSKSNVDNGVVDSPPSRGLRRSPIVLPSPLQGSLCRHCSDCSASPTPHRQLYKHYTDEAPLHAPLLIQIGCASTALLFQVGNINPRSHALDYPCFEDNMWIACVDDGRQPQFVSEMKHGTDGGQHPCSKGKVYLHRSFPSKVVGIVS